METFLVLDEACQINTADFWHNFSLIRRPGVRHTPWRFTFGCLLSYRLDKKAAKALGGNPSWKLPVADQLQINKQAPGRQSPVPLIDSWQGFPFFAPF